MAFEATISPGLHAAKQLLGHGPTEGEWFDATKYGRAKYKASLRKKPKEVLRAQFIQKKTIRLDVLPAWQSLTPMARQDQLMQMHARIVEAGRKSRGAKPALGEEAVMGVPLTERRALPKPPWWQERRRMICWSSPTAPETVAYVKRYWDFQRAFREASTQASTGSAATFPPGSFVPGDSWPRRRVSSGAPSLAR